MSTATVETLTAEVRVLQVGSRQITLSVARQLDEVSIYEMEIFGRVKMHADPATVIGRHKETGALVVCHYDSVATLRRVRERDAGRIAFASQLDALPLIVLAGLR